MSSPAKPTTGIDDLPPEMICALFKHLQLKDLVTCSMVNKRWHSIYAGFKVQRLVVHSVQHLRHWSYPNRRIEAHEQCRADVEFCRLANKPLLSSLKHLALTGYEYEFDLNQLNKFQQLRHLEIKLGRLGQKKVFWNLPNLKVLVFHQIRYLHTTWTPVPIVHPLSIDCPALSLLVYPGEPEDANLLELKHPEAIRKLKTNLFDSQWLTAFKNLECLVTDQRRAISEATLLSLPRLSELHYHQDVESAFAQFHDRITLRSIKQTLTEFLDDAKRLGRRNFQLRFGGLRLDKITLDQIDFGVETAEITGRERVFNEYVYAKNYQLIDPAAPPFFPRSFDYNRLMSNASGGLLSNVTGELPSCFSSKFIGIESVQAKISTLREAIHFLRFLKSLKFVEVASLTCADLGPKFCRQLRASTRSLAILLLKYAAISNGRQLNFDFDFDVICDFPGSLSLEILHELSFESISSLVRSLDNFAGGNVRFFWEGRQFAIQKRRGFKECTVYDGHSIHCGRTLFKTENPSELLDFFDKNF